MEAILDDGRTIVIEGEPSPEEVDQIVTSFLEEEARAQSSGGVHDQITSALDGLKRNIPTVPDKLPHGMTQGAIDAVTKQTQAFNQKLEDVKADPMRRTMFEQGMKATGPEAFGVSAMNELVSLGKGTADLADQYLPEFLSNALHGFSGSPKERMVDRAKEMGRQNASQEGLDLSHPFASMGGRAIPYLLTDIVGSPVIGGAVSKAAKLTSPARSSAMRGLERLEKAAEGSESPIKQKLGELFVEPLVTSGKHFANKTTMDPEYNKAVAALARAPLLGAAEGAANYNMTAGEGAINSAIGQGIGNVSMLTYLGKPAKTTSKSEKLAIKNAMRDGGYTPPPGMITGNIYQQRFEKGLAAEEGYSTYMQQLANSNASAKMKMAMKAMGMKDADSRDLTPEKLDSHIKDMKDEMNSLEASTTGKMGNKKINEAGGVLKELRHTGDETRYKAVKGIFDYFKKEIASPKRSANGQFQGYTFNGGEYQRIRSRISSEAKQAYATNDYRLGDSLTKLRDILDDSLESGMDKATVSQWKDVNERYAMTEFVTKNGLDALGGIDDAKLSSFLMSQKESKRTLLDQGNRIKHLHNIAKINQVEKRQGGRTDLNTSGIEPSTTGKTGMLNRILTMPITSTLTPGKRAGMSLYMSGFPAVTGYTGIPKPAIARGIRATGQAGGFLGAVEDQGRSLLDPDYDEYKKNEYDQLLEAIKGQ